MTTEAQGTSVKTRVGTLAIPVETVESVDVTPANFDGCKRQILAVEQECYGTAAPDPAPAGGGGEPPAGRPSPLQFSLDTLEATMANPRAVGVAIRDRVSGRYIAYALGSALENHDDEGVGSDPHFGENNTFYLHAAATLPAVQNRVEIENFLLDSLRERVVAAGFEYSRASSRRSWSRPARRGCAKPPSSIASTTTWEAACSSCTCTRLSGL